MAVDSINSNQLMEVYVSEIQQYAPQHDLYYNMMTHQNKA